MSAKLSIWIFFMASIILLSSFNHIQSINYHDHSVLPSQEGKNHRQTNVHYETLNIPEIIPEYNYRYYYNHSFKVNGELFEFPEGHQDTNRFCLFQRVYISHAYTIDAITFHNVKFNPYSYSRIYKLVITYDYKNFTTNYIYTQSYTLPALSNQITVNITFSDLNINIPQATNIYIGFYHDESNSNANDPVIPIYLNSTSQEVYGVYSALINLANASLNHYEYYQGNIDLTINTSKIGYQPITNVVFAVNKSIYEKTPESIALSFHAILDQYIPNSITKITFHSYNGTNITYTYSKSKVINITLMDRIKTIEFYVAGNITTYNALSQMHLTIWHNNPPLIASVQHHVIIKRNSQINPLDYLVATDPDGDDLLYSYNPPLNEIDTSIPSSYNITITIRDNIDYPAEVQTYIVFEIENHAPHITSYQLGYTYLVNSTSYNATLSPLSFRQSTYNYTLILKLPPNATLMAIHHYCNTTDPDNDIINVIATLNEHLNLPLNTSQIYLYKLIATDNYKTITYNITLKIIIPIAYYYHYNHTYIKTEIKEKPIYINNTIIKERVIYINQTSNCTNNSSSSNQTTNKSAKLSQKELEELKQNAYKRFYSDAQRSFTIVILILIIIVLLIFFALIDKYYRYFHNPNRPSIIKRILHNDEDIEDKEDEFEEEFNEDLTINLNDNDDEIEIPEVEVVSAPSPSKKPRKPTN